MLYLLNPERFYPALFLAFFTAQILLFYTPRTVGVWSRRLAEARALCDLDAYEVLGLCHAHSSAAASSPQQVSAVLYCSVAATLVEVVYFCIGVVTLDTAS